MGCTEQKFICYNSKKRKIPVNHLETKIENKNQEINNESQIKNNIQENIIIEEQKQIKNEIEDKKIEQERSFNYIQNINENNINISVDKSIESDDNSEIPYRNLQMLRELTPYLQTKNNPNFNFPEVKENIFVGKGLRKMKGYISIVPKDELEKKRIAFWGTRIEGNPQVWTFLKELCELPIGEEKNMKAMLEANEIKPLLKCINITYDKNGAVYEIPNYCINEPYSYDLPEMHVKKPKNKDICFYARRGVKQIKLQFSNDTLIEKVKEEVGKQFEININDLRMFFGGKELKNGNELWKYNINNDCVIIVL